MTLRRMKFWGWGYADEGVDTDEVDAVVSHITSRLGVKGLKPEAAPDAEDIALAPSRVDVPDSLAALCSIEPYERIVHTYGKSFLDYARTLEGDFNCAPDVVAFPSSEQEIVDLLDWASGSNLAVIPFGAGSTVVGGIEPMVGESYDGVVTMDLRRLDRVLEIDRQSRAARIQAGIFGPRAGSGAKTAWFDLAALSAVIRVLDTWRLDSDAFRRPFRDALHAYRRFCRKPGGW